MLSLKGWVGGEQHQFPVDAGVLGHPSPRKNHKALGLSVHGLEESMQLRLTLGILPLYVNML